MKIIISIVITHHTIPMMALMVSCVVWVNVKLFLEFSYTLIPRGAPDLTCLVRGRQWLSLPGKRVKKGEDIDVNYIQPVYEH